MGTDTLGGWSLEELDELNIKAGGSPYWTVKQFGFTDMSVPYMYSQ